MLLLAKLTIAPAFVAAVSLIGRRFGPAVAGFLAALPVVGGPILALLIAEQGLEFGARAAFACAIGAAPTMIFALAYSLVAPRVRWGRAITLGYATYFVAAAVLLAVPPSLTTATIVPLATWWLVLRVFPRASAEAFPRAPSRWDLPVRIVATMTLVLLITTLASVIGPERSGLFTPFPIATAVLAVFAHRDAGGASASVLLRALVRGLVSFVAFFVVVGATLDAVGAIASFVTGGLVALGVHAIVSKLAR
ncbi:Hypothetical protein I5071_67080 [Sandaracinus amylolyticus]|nr:Hypothetical protein I5071_67080 [Sandaracinus amylolyticus]